jgi:hypothetical protein
MGENQQADKAQTDKTKRAYFVPAFLPAGVGHDFLESVGPHHRNARRALQGAVQPPFVRRNGVVVIGILPVLIHCRLFREGGKGVNQNQHGV